MTDLTWIPCRGACLISNNESRCWYWCDLTPQLLSISNALICCGCNWSFTRPHINIMLIIRLPLETQQTSVYVSAIAAMQQLIEQTSGCRNDASSESYIPILKIRKLQRSTKHHFHSLYESSTLQFSALFIGKQLASAVLSSPAADINWIWQQYASCMPTSAVSL